MLGRCPSDRLLRLPGSSDLKEAASGNSVEPRKYSRCSAEGPHLWINPSADVYGFRLLFRSWERDCARGSEREQREAVKSQSLINPRFLVIVFGNVELNTDLQSKWA